MDEAIVLRRSLTARLFAGFWLQTVLTLAVALELGLVVLLALEVGARTALAAGSPGLVLLILWGCGVTAWARADAAGVQWRYFLRHRHAWADVQEVRYGSAFVTGGTVGASAAAIYVRARGVEHPIVPAYGCSPARVREFADGLAALAGSHAVPTEADSGHWDSLGALPGVARTPHRTPGRVVSRSLQRLRLRLTGLALLVVAGCALAGAFTGWEAHGVAERVVFGIVGLVLALIGLLLAIVPGD